MTVNDPLQAVTLMHINGCRDKACLVSTVEYARRGGPLLVQTAVS